MCQIISVPAGKEVDLVKLDKAQVHNQDGYGVSWYEDGVVKTYKTMNYVMFRSMVGLLTEYTKIVHLRYNTVGKTTLENCHPFSVPNGGVMFHNGTISGLKPTGSYIKGKWIKSDESDTSLLAKLLNDSHYESIWDVEALLYGIIGTYLNKLAFMESDGTVTILNEELGEEEDGIWYSNDYHKKDKNWHRTGETNPKYKPKTPPKQVTKKETPSEHKLTKVFVYGTLKRGYGNHKYHLANATYLGKANTTQKWTMIGKYMAFPYVVEQCDTAGNNVEGEVYQVTPKELEALDRLEGVSHGHYKKVATLIKYSDTKTNELVTMYVAVHKPQGYEKAEYLTTWSK